MNNTISKSLCVAAFGAALSVFFVQNAEAACASKSAKPQYNSTRLFETASPSRAFEFPAPESPGENQANDNDSDATVVGLWSITYFVGSSSSVWDQGFEQWHSDGLELNNDNAVPPSLGNVCVGVYKQVGPRTFKLRHMTWNFDASGQWTGTFSLIQMVTVAPNGKTFTGSYVSDSFDVDGKVIPSLHAEGNLSAKRITVD